MTIYLKNFNIFEKKSYLKTSSENTYFFLIQTNQFKIQTKSIKTKWKKHTISVKSKLDLK